MSLAVVAAPSIAQAAPAGAFAARVYRPPFEDRYGIGFMTMGSPCWGGVSAVRPLGPSAQTGRLDHSTGVSVSGCTYVAGGLTNFWRLAELPPDMIGRSGTAFLVVEVIGTHLVVSGSPQQSSARGSLSLGGSSWITAQVSCIKGQCTSTRMQRIPGTRVAILRATMSALPQMLDLAIDRGFSIDSGTGSIGMEFYGKLRGLVVVPGLGTKADFRARMALLRLSSY